MLPRSNITFYSDSAPNLQEQICYFFRFLTSVPVELLTLFQECNCLQKGIKLIEGSTNT